MFLAVKAKISLGFGTSKLGIVTLTLNCLATTYTPVESYVNVVVIV